MIGSCLKRHPIAIGPLMAVREAALGRCVPPRGHWPWALVSGQRHAHRFVADVARLVLSDETRTSITTHVWLRFGLPLMLRTHVVANLLVATLIGWVRIR